MAEPAFRTPFFAPQARLVDAATNNVIGEAVGGASTLSQTLVSAKVTLGINSVCQLQVVLDNQRHQHGMPVFPPWKYNTLQQIQFGQRLRLDLRYGDDPAWHKMIVARVTDLQFGFPQSGASQLTIIGEDLLSILKTKSDREKPYSNHKEDYIVRDVLVRSKANALHLSFVGTTAGDDPLKGPLVPWPELEPLRSITHAKDTTYLQFLQNIADRMDFEMFVDFEDRLILDHREPTANDSDVKLHFEPSRSVVAPKDPLPLTWGTDLIEFTPKFKVWEQLTEVTVAGTRHGTRRRHSYKIGATDKEVTKDLHDDPDYTIPGPRGPTPVKLVAAGEIRARYFAKEVNGATPVPPNPSAISASNLDPDRIKLQAIAQLRKSMRDVLTADGATIGRPGLRPGIHVKIGGLYPPFDGLYYVTQTVHTFDANGYRTQFSLRRPGMLDAAQYPGDDT